MLEKNLIQTVIHQGLMVVKQTTTSRGGTLNRYLITQRGNHYKENLLFPPRDVLPQGICAMYKISPLHGEEIFTLHCSDK